jgi:hypothetical protein
MKDDSKKLAEARTWAWASLIIGTLVLLGSIASFAWPFIPLQLFSVIGSLFFLYGGEQQMRCSVVMLGVVAAFELMGGAVTFLFALYFVAFPGQFGGFGLLIGIYALVFSIPTLAIGGIDFYTVRLVRGVVFGEDSSAPEKDAMVPPMDTLKV